MTRETLKAIMKVTKYSPDLKFSEDEKKEYEKRKKKIIIEELKLSNDEHRMNQIKKLIHESGLESMIAKCTFDNFQCVEPWQEKMFEMAKNYASNPYGWIYVSGQSGCGKTHLCTAIAGEIMKKGIGVAYMLWRQDSEKMKPSNKNDEERNHLLSIFGNAECLYIDDLFKGGITNADLKLAFDLIDLRYRTNSLTIISSEMYIGEIMSKDEAIASRIIEMSTKNIISVANKKGRNWRIKKIGESI